MIRAAPAHRARSRQRNAATMRHCPNLCDAHLREVVRLEQERRWRVEHAEFVAAYNATVEAEGLPLDAHRTF